MKKNLHQKVQQILKNFSVLEKQANNILMAFTDDSRGSDKTSGNSGEYYNQTLRNWQWGKKIKGLIKAQN